MKAEFSVINNAWVILYGENIIDIDGQRFFTTKQELKDVLHAHNLKLVKDEVKLIEV